MQWRNEQIYHLRQDELLTKEKQDQYFTDVVSKLFPQESPNQILFSYLKNDKCIGYGGLVHINWKDKNAEISFIMDTSLEEEYFEYHWSKYLELIEEVAFEQLNFHKIYTYAFDLRPRLYIALANREFRKEATLNEHCLFEGKFVDVLIHSKIKLTMILREAASDDLETTYTWANDKLVRTFAYNQKRIEKEEHSEWFLSKLSSNNCKYYILEENKNKIAGSIRFDIDDMGSSAMISYLVDPRCTGRGYGTYLLENGIKKLVQTKPNIDHVYGFVIKENIASIRIFEKLKFSISYQNDREIKFEKTIA